MGIKRIGRHLVAHRWRVRRIFPPDVMAVIERAIKAGEATHSGQVRFVVEGALDGAPLFRDQPARERALDVFSQLRIWDTADNNGVLIYLLLADHDVEIVADRGIDAKVGVRRLGRNLQGDGDRVQGRRIRPRRDQGHRRGVAVTGDAFSAGRRRQERTAGYAGGDVSSFTLLSRATGRSRMRTRGGVRCGPSPRYSAPESTVARSASLRNRRCGLVAVTVTECAYAFADGRSPTRANQAAILVLAGIERLADLVAEIEPAVEQDIGQREALAAENSLPRPSVR